MSGDWAPPCEAIHVGVFAFLKQRAGNGITSVSYGDIARALGCHETGVRSAIRSLEREQVIEVRRSKTPVQNTYRILAEPVAAPIRWTRERHDWLDTHYPNHWSAWLVEGINELPGPVVKPSHVKDYARDRGWHKTPELLATRQTPAAPPRAPKPPKPSKIERRPAPAKMVKKPSAAPVFSLRQTVFQPGPSATTCAWRGCHRQRVGTWCAEHAAALLLPADRVVDALEALNV